MCEQCVPGSLSSFPAQEPGNEARVQVALSPGLPTVQLLSMPNWRGRPGPLHHVNDVSVYLGRQGGERSPIE